MSLWQAILLGIIQGLTEFIPISSTAHLTIAGKLFGLIDPARPDQWTAFIAVIQLGTLIAVIAYFWTDVLRIIRGFVALNLNTITRQPIESSIRRDGLLGWFVVLGTIPISVVGLAFRHQIEGTLTKNLWVISGSLIGLAIVLTIAEFVGRQERDIDKVRFGDALAVGVAQVFALIPGSSRSGTTITGGLLVGLKRETAARFSFLLSMPAIGASGLLELPKALRSVDTDWTLLIVSTTVSAIAGYLSIAFLLKYLQRHTTFLFVGYRIVLGVVLIALLMKGFIEA
jgi:undecaprenyl-diphosphatase